MSHKKVHSQGLVPFLWEASPGISKGVLTQTKMNPYHRSYSNIPKTATQEGKVMKIPPPPCPSRPPHRTCSTKSLRRVEDDPFLVALKECTKSSGNGKTANTTTAIVSVMGFRVRRSKCSFSCKRGDSCDVEDGNLVKLPSLPRIPRVKSAKTK